MLPEDTAILHPGSYGFRSYVAQLVTRAVAANDTAQRAALKAYLTNVNIWVSSSIAWSFFTWPADGAGHKGRHLHWLSKEIHHKSLTNADIKIDASLICQAAVLLL